jgi:PIN domain nuclease of toxin-antitoxin system
LVEKAARDGELAISAISFWEILFLSPKAECVGPTRLENSATSF